MDSRNVKQSEIPDPGDDVLGAIFTRQQQLMDKYRDIEGMPPSFDVRTRETQVWVKDFLWRITEEICEALEYFRDGKSKYDPLVREELSDALHFFVEMCLILGIDSKQLIQLSSNYMSKNAGRPENFSVKDLDGLYKWILLNLKPRNPAPTTMAFEVIYDLGLIGNTMKNKPWKQTDVDTDVAKLQGLVGQAFVSLIILFHSFGIPYEEIYTVYWKKSVINKFRQDSKY